MDPLEARYYSIALTIYHARPDFPKARVGVLFSGGLDCTVLALLADKSLPEQEVSGMRQRL